MENQNIESNISIAVSDDYGNNVEFLLGSTRVNIIFENHIIKMDKDNLLWLIDQLNEFSKRL